MAEKLTLLNIPTAGDWALGGASGTFDATLDLDFDIEIYPADPIPGEAVAFRIVNITGLPPLAFPYLQTAVLADFGDPGATYESGGGADANANRAMGRVAAHVYETAGNYTASFTMHVAGAGSVTRAVSVPVVDVVQASLTRDLYLDFGEVSGTPDFSFAPAETGNVTHVATAAQFNAINLRLASESTRITFKDDETFTALARDIDGEGSTYILRRSGDGTAKPQLLFSDDLNGGVSTIFDMRTGSVRVVVIGLDADGEYDPTTGIGPKGKVDVFACNGNPPADRYVSIWRSKCRGLRNFFNGRGADALTARTAYVRYVDNDFADWVDYGIQWFGEHNAMCITGNRIVQSPLAIVRDAKGTLPEAPDHGCTRIQHSRWGCVENNLELNSGGWSNASPTKSIQPANRFHTAETAQQAAWEMCAHRNITAGHYFAKIGSVSDTNEIKQAPAGLVMTHNILYSGRQGFGGFAEIDCSGVYASNNTHYAANVGDPTTHQPNFLVEYDIGTETYDNPEVKNGTIAAIANTIVSDKSAVSGGNAEYSVLDDFSAGWGTGFTKTDSANLVHTAGHTNGTDINADISRGDDFKLLTGASQFGAVTGADDLTPLDIDLTARSLPTSPGAHHTGAGSATAVPAPTNSVAPTIAALSSFPDEYALSDFGTWAGLDQVDYYLVEHDWQLDGVSITNNRNTTADAAGLSGDLTCDVTMTNRSGIRVTVTSNTIAI